MNNYTDNYSLSEINININQPLAVEGSANFSGNVNVNSSVKALEDISLSGDGINTNNSVILSENGDITIDGTNVSLNGLLYAPSGSIEITSQTLNLNSVVIIADTITLSAPYINASGNSSVAHFICEEYENNNDDDSDEDSDDSSLEDDSSSDVDDSDIDSDDSSFEDDNIPEEDIIPEIEAYGEYNSSESCIDITWYTNCKNADYEILSSDDNESYTSIAIGYETDTYSYQITEDFDIKYFKVSVILEGGESVCSAPFVVKKTEDGYSVEPIDTDGDGLNDAYEDWFATDINKTDTDGDDLSDYDEIYLTDTDPLVFDSVIENIPDSLADTDTDGVDNITEITLGTDPQRADTENDGLSDYDELNTYGTEPADEDTDDDGLLDGEEILLGTDPANPDTDGNGIADGDEVFEQEVNEESLLFAEINTEDNPYRLSLEISTTGYAERALTVNESGYSAAIGSNAVLGIAAEIIFNSSCNVDSYVIKFNISESSIANEINISPDEPDLQGIKRLVIFKFFEDINMLLPVETMYDVENNTVYTTASEQGTYCLMDIEKWYIQLTGAEEYPAQVLNAVSSELYSGYEEENGERHIITYAGETDEAEAIYDEPILYSTTSYASASESESVSSDIPVDVVFILQTSGLSQRNYNAQVNIIKNVAERLYAAFEDVRIYIIRLHISSDITSASFAKADANANENYLTDYDDVLTVLDDINYTVTYDRCNRSSAYYLVIDKLEFRSEASRFIFQMLNGNFFGRIGYLETDVCNKVAANFSLIHPYSLRYDDSQFAARVTEAIKATNGVSFYLNESTSNAVYNHIVQYAKPQSTKFEVVIPTSWQKVTLDDVLSPDNGANTDGDLLTDWEEIDLRSEYISFDRNGNIELMTVREFFEQNPLNAWVDLYYPTLGYESINEFFDTLGDYPILPIKSDPTKIDSDYDYYVDGDELSIFFSSDLYWNKTRIDDSDIDDSESINGVNPAIDREDYENGKLSRVTIGENGTAEKNVYTFERSSLPEYKHDNYSAVFSLKPEDYSDYAITVTDVSCIEDVKIKVTYVNERFILSDKTVKVKQISEPTLENGQATFYFALEPDKDTSYTIKINNNSGAESFKVLVSQDNWVYAPNGGAWHVKEYSKNSITTNAFGASLVTGRLYMPSHKVLEAISVLRNDSVIIESFAGEDIEAQIKFVLDNSNMSVSDEELYSALVDLSGTAAEVVIAIVVPGKKEKATIALVYAIANGVSKSSVIIGTVNNIITVFDYLEQFGFKRACLDGDINVISTHYASAVLGNVWDGWTTAPYIPKISINGDIGEILSIDEEDIPQYIIDWCDWSVD